MSAKGNDTSTLSGLEQLLFFNGRFLNATDLRTEQSTLLLRHQLAERAIGPGISYGFDVAMKTRTVQPGVIADVAQKIGPAVADAVKTSFEAVKSQPSVWGSLFKHNETPAEHEALLNKMTDAAKLRVVTELRRLNDVDPEALLNATVRVAAGHASDGDGRDLYLGGERQLKLADLWSAYQASPTECTTAAAAIIPRVSQSPAGAGAYLLTAKLKLEAHDPVPVYSAASCTDAGAAASTLGFTRHDVDFQLVRFASTVDVNSGMALDVRGAGARAYFDSALSFAPLGAGSHPAPQNAGTHVPLAMIYLSDKGGYVAHDVWTARRLREPAELGWWLQLLTFPSRTAQLARVLQFQTQLSDGLATATTQYPGLGTLGFSFGGNPKTIEVPGVGFLPFGTAGTPPDHAKLQTAMASFFPTAASRILFRHVGAGVMNHVFSGALASVPLQVGLPPANDSQADVSIWYQNDARYPGYVMFTWPMGVLER
jgi:hypothetical protein